jgi:hypothetical protein
MIVRHQVTCGIRENALSATASCLFRFGVTLGLRDGCARLSAGQAFSWIVMSVGGPTIDQGVT